MSKRVVAVILIVGSVFLLSPSAVFAQTSKVARVTGIPDGACLYLHSRPITGNVDVIGCIPKGETVALFAVNEDTGWAGGCWGDVCGYLSYPHLTVVEEPIQVLSATPLEEKETSTQDSVERPTEKAFGNSSTNNVDGGICLAVVFVVILVILALTAGGNRRKRQLELGDISGGDGPDYSRDRCRSCDSEFAREGYSDDNGNRFCPNCGEKDVHDDGP